MTIKLTTGFIKWKSYTLNIYTFPSKQTFLQDDLLIYIYDNLHAANNLYKII